MALKAYRRPVATLFLVFALLGVALWGALQLGFDADLVELLPKKFRSVQDIDRLKERFGGIGYVVVVGSNAEPEALRRFADDVAPQIEKLPAVRYVEYRRPKQFFQDRALYFFDLDDLATIKTRLRAREKWEKRQHNPMYIDLEESKPPDLKFDDLEKKYTNRSDREWMEAQASQSYYLDPDRRLIALLVKPARMASNLDFSREVVGEVQAYLDGLDLSQYGPAMRVDLTGRYKKRIDMQAMISQDLTRASSLALVLMILYLAIHFRRVRAVFLILIPLVVGLVWTFGFAGYRFESLNILTGFIGAILLGLGIDHGIHLLGRFEVELSEGRSEEESIRSAFGNTGRAVLVAAVTTIIAFLGLGFSEFRAFSEFGIIAGIGMVLVVLAYLICLPALLGVFARFRWQLPRAQHPTGSGYARILGKWAPTLFWLFLLAVFGAAVYIPSDQFDYDFASLEASGLPSFRLDLEVNKLLGYSQTPVVILASDESEERFLASSLRERKQALEATGQASTIDFIAAGADLVPLDQDKKYKIIKEIGRIIRKVKPKWLPPSDRDKLADLKRMTSTKPFGRKDLPEEVRRMFAGPNASAQEGFVLVFPAISLSDGILVPKFAQEVRGVSLPSGQVVSAAGEAMILADILNMVSQEAPPVLLLTLVLVVLALWLLLGRAQTALLCLLPAASTLILVLGLLPLSGQSLNYLNIIMIPVLFGIGVDGAVHLVTRSSSTQGLGAAVNETGRSISGAILTTGLGFGALLLADHQGLNSLGDLALLGLSTNLLSCLVGLPALLELANRHRAKTVGPQKTDLGGLLVSDLATVGLAGESPKGPGTLGALIALPIAWIFSKLSWPVVMGLMIIGIILSIGIASRYVANRRDKDPSEVVIDEFIGCLLTLVFVPWKIGWVVAAFCLFRLFDIVKPWPIRIIDRNVGGGIGIVLDDLLAGLFAAGLLLVIQYLAQTQGWF